MQKPAVNTQGPSNKGEEGKRIALGHRGRDLGHAGDFLISPKNFMMPKHTYSTIILAAWHRRITATLMACLICSLAGIFGMTSTAAAQGGMMLTSFNQPLVPNEDWRASGLAYVELPLRIRASFDASYRQHGTLSDRLASPLVNDVGPGIISDETLESRISFTRPITERIEIEVAWLTSNRLTTGDPMGFGRQIVGAFIRLTP